MKRILIALLILTTVTKARSQTWSTTGSGTITVGTVFSITLSNQAATPTFTTAANYQNGKTTLNYATVAIKSNVDWIVSFKAQASFFTPQTQGGSTNMPASVVGVRLNGNVTFLTLSTTNQTLKMGSNGPATLAGNTFNIDMFFNPGFNYVGGIYNMSVLYTLTQQ